MKTKYNYLLIIGLLVFVGPQGIIQAQQLAFPTAEGFGANSMGGRGGDVYHVTNLNDDGAGSLRFGIESASGPRTIVFDTSGTITLESKLSVNRSYITIAGQTAPGDGICLKDYQLTISASHVIVRYIRSRLGDQAGQESDAISITSGKNIIMDHCSASWSVDEVFSCSTGDRDKIDNVTVQWSFISEALEESIHGKGSHGYGALIRGCYGAKYSYLHNLFAHNKARNPRPGNYDYNTYELDPLGLQFDFRNNVMYNWGGNRPGYDADSESVCRYNYVGNYGIPGPESDRTGYAYDVGSTHFRAYYSGNHFFGSIPTNQWSLVNFSGFSAAQIAAYKRPIPFSTGPMETLSAQEAYTTVMAHVGASLKRDSVDTRVIGDVQNGTGSFIDSPSEVGGWPLLTALPAPLDTDQDGMPDVWENNNGLDPGDPADRNDDSRGNGYTNLEEYLNELVNELPVWYYMQVNSGSGTGAYAEATEVEISAKKMWGGLEFDYWSGDTTYLADPRLETTTVTIPSSGIYLNAVYKDVTSVEMNENKSVLRCYPNPSEGVFSIDLSSIGNSSIEIYSMDGQSVYHALSSGTVHHVYDHRLSSGLYLVKVRDASNAVYTQKMLIK